MSSITNITIGPQNSAKDIPLGRILGREGCAAFEKELGRLADDQRSAWQRVPRTTDTYRIAIREGLPANVQNVDVTVRVMPGVLEVHDDWEYVGRRKAPAQVTEQVSRLVARTVNQPVMNVVANGIEARLRSRLKTEVKNRALATNRVQVYAQVRTGGGR